MQKGGIVNQLFPQYQNPYSAGMYQARYGLQPHQAPQDGLQFVNGAESAKAYQMPPNSKQILMDANRARFYLKETDAAGMASIKAYDFMEATEDAPKVDMSEYVTREEFEAWKKAQNESTTKRAARKSASEAEPA